MLNSGDMVEEISTNRKGRVALGRFGGSMTWTVHFIDGKQPLIKGFADITELRLVQGQDQHELPRLIPERWVV